MIEVLEQHRRFYGMVCGINPHDIGMIQSKIDELRRKAVNRNDDSSGYFFYVRQIAGEYAIRYGHLRSIEHEERTENEKEVLSLLASFADLEEGKQKIIIDDIEAGCKKG